MRNYVIHLPNDPTREKAGWTQDVWNQFECTAYNFDCSATYAEWQRDFIEIQHDNGYVPPVAPSRFDGPTINGPWWGGAIVYNPWMIYRFYGDRRLLDESYPAMKRQTAYLESIAKDDVVSWGLGDWLEVGSVRPIMTPVPFTSTAAYAWFTSLVARSAEITGRKEEALQYKARADRLNRSFHRQFYNAKTGVYAKGSQTSQVLPLALGLTPADQVAKVRERLVEAVREKKNHLSTGFIGTPVLLTGLSRRRIGRTGLEDRHAARLSRLVRHAFQSRKHGHDRDVGRQRRADALARRADQRSGSTARWPAFAPIRKTPASSTSSFVPRLSAS